MNTNTGISINVELRTTKGSTTSMIREEGEQIVVSDLIASLAKTEWACHLFKTEGDEIKLLPGYLMILDNRMVQPWEAENTPVSEGQTLRFIQMVPGG